MDIQRLFAGFLGTARMIAKYLVVPTLIAVLLPRFAGAATVPLVSQLDKIQLILAQIGPALSAVLFVLAGIFYAIGQMLPPEKKANFHTAAVNIIIGAIVVGALSFASTSLAVASTHLVGNFTAINSSV
ncbi:MAG: hypothetical protein ACREBH_01910 [Candidatus Micrarchaeaceae archaeon]